MTHADQIVPEELRHPLPKYDAREEQVGVGENEKGRSDRTVVRITRFGIRLLDADNLCGGVKFLLDACRYEGLIPEDNPGAIRLIVAQRKVKMKETGTLLEIFNP